MSRQPKINVKRLAVAAMLMAMSVVIGIFCKTVLNFDGGPMELYCSLILNFDLLCTG